METLSSQEKAMETVRCCAERETVAEREAAVAEREAADATVEIDESAHDAPHQVCQMSQCCSDCGEGNAHLLVKLISSKVTLIL